MTTPGQLRVPVQDSERSIDDSPRQKKYFTKKVIKILLVMLPFVIGLLLYVVYLGGGELQNYDQRCRYFC